MCERIKIENFIERLNNHDFKQGTKFKFLDRIYIYDYPSLVGIYEIEKPTKPEYSIFAQLDMTNLHCEIEIINEPSMGEEEKEELQELINLLYNGHISQYGKRKLITYIEKQQAEIKQLKEDISNMYDEKVVRNILEDECGLSKYEIDEILN